MSSSIRTVIRWQLAATALLTLGALMLFGAHTAVSAALGGLISIVSELAFSRLIRKPSGQTAAGILVIALRAELIRLGLMVSMVLLVLLLYRDVVVFGLVSSFVVTVIIFTMSFFVHEAEASSGS